MENPNDAGRGQHDLRLAPHFLGALHPAPPFHPHRVLQVTTIPGTRHESRGLFYIKTPFALGAMI